MPIAPKIAHNIRDLNDWASIPDGSFLKRTGSTIVGGTSAEIAAAGGAQPGSPGLTSIASASGDNTIYYHVSANNSWSPVLMGDNLLLSSSTLKTINNPTFTGSVTTPSITGLTFIGSDNSPSGGSFIIDGAGRGVIIHGIDVGIQELNTSAQNIDIWMQANHIYFGQPLGDAPTNVPSNVLGFFSRKTGATCDVEIQTWSNTGPQLLLHRSRGAPGATAPILSGDILGTVAIKADYGTNITCPAITYYDATSGCLNFIASTNETGSIWYSSITIDSSGNVGQYASMATVSGTPAASYYDATNHQLKFIRSLSADGSTWPTTGIVVDTGGVGGNTGQYTSLVVVNGNPAISYYDVSGANLKYVRANDVFGSTWGTTVTIDTSGTTGQFTSMAILSGFPAISYYNATDGDLKFVRATDINGTTWGTPVKVITTGDIGQYTSLVTIPSGSSSIPIIAFYAVNSGDVKTQSTLSEDASQQWSAGTNFDTTGDTGKFLSLANIGGTAGISYYDATNGDLKFAISTTVELAAWTISTVDSTGDVGQYTSLALVNGFPAISYYDVTNGTLKFVRANNSTGTLWPAANAATPPITIDTRYGHGQYTSLGTAVQVRAVQDVANFIRTRASEDHTLTNRGTNMSIRNCINGTSTMIDRLYFSSDGLAAFSGSLLTGALSSGPLTVSGAVSASGLISAGLISAGSISAGSISTGPITVGAITATSLSTSSTISNSVSSISLTANNILANSTISNSVLANTISLTDDPYNASIWTGNLTAPTKNAIRYQFENRPAFAQNIISLSSNIVNGDLIGGESWIGNLMVPAVTYYDVTSGDLKFAYALDNTGSTWSTPIIVDSTGNVGQYTSMAVVNNFPAITYYDATSATGGVLKYVRATSLGGKSWGTPVQVDSLTGVGQYSSLVVVNGNPAISYYDASGGNLKYVRATDINGTTWGTPVYVDITNDVGQFSSMAILSGFPAISYYSAAPLNDLKVVRALDVNGTTWGVPVTITSSGNTGQYTSMATPNNLPCVGFYVVSTGNLVWAVNNSPDADVGTTGAWTFGQNAGGGNTSFTIDSPGDVGKYISQIALSGNTIAAMSYYDATSGNLKFTRVTDGGDIYGGAGWTNSTVVNDINDVGQYTSMALVHNNPAITYYNVTSGCLDYVRSNDGLGATWSTPITIDSTANVGQYTSLVVVPISSVSLVNIQINASGTLSTTNFGTEIAIRNALSGTSVLIDRLRFKGDGSALFYGALSSGPLTVSGSISASGSIATGGPLTVSGSISAGGPLTVSGSISAGGIFSASTISLRIDDSYNQSTWDSNLGVPTKNALRDKIETMPTGSLEGVTANAGGACWVLGNNTNFTIPAFYFQPVFTDIGGSLPATQLPAFTGDVITSVGTAATSIKSSVALSGTPTAPTAAVDTNTQQIASTAFVIGQGYAKLASPTFSGTPSLPTGTTGITQAIGDNTTKLATTSFVVSSVSLSGVPTTTTAAIDTTTAQIASTAFVINQAYAKLASPTFSGTPSLPTGTTAATQALNDFTTKIATTAFVLGQAATVAPLANGVAAVGLATKFAREDHVHVAPTTITGNAGTATALQTARAINGTNFDGSAAITIIAPISGAMSMDSLTTRMGSASSGRGGTVTGGAILPFIAYATNVPIISGVGGAPGAIGVDIAVISLSGINRWRCPISAATAQLCTIYSETAGTWQGGTHSQAAFIAYSGPGATGQPMTATANGPTAAGATAGWTGTVPGTLATTNTVYIRQTNVSQNSGTCSFYIYIDPLPSS